MIRKFFSLFYNGVRFVGRKNYFKIISVQPSTKIFVSKNGTLNIGEKFRTRFNVELNVRDEAVLEIGNNVFFNSGCIVTAREKVSIGNNTIFGPNVVIYDNDHRILDGRVLDNEFITKPVKIGNNVWVGAGAIILKGTVIEDNCIIAAGSIVRGIVKQNSVLVQKKYTDLLPIEKGLSCKHNES